MHGTNERIFPDVSSLLNRHYVQCFDTADFIFITDSDYPKYQYSHFQETIADHFNIFRQE
jgi:hypothetical protein